MANIIEEFLDKREYNYKKTVDRKDQVKCEVYTIDGLETLDGLDLSITVSTIYMSGTPFAQDFLIKSNRGKKVVASFGEVFDELRKYL